MTKMRKISLAAVSVLLSAFLLLSGFLVYKELSDRQKEKEDFAELAKLVQIEPQLPDETPPPTNDEPESAHKRDLAPLFAQNSDCVGWLCVPGTGVDYPVMHTPENPQKYLRRNFYGEYSQSGVPFLDYRCDLQSDNLIFYGHNMKNGTMFSSLRNYTDSAFCAGHPVIEFQTAGGASKYTVFAVAAVQKTDAWYSFIHAADREEYKKQLEAIQGKALYCSETMPEYGAQLLTLSTCYGSGKDGRLLIIVAKTQ